MLVNFHCHSSLSTDARSSMSDMARAACGAGIGVLCVTDFFTTLKEGIT